MGSVPGSGRSPGEGNSNPLQYSCLENLMDRGAWRATVHEVAKNRTQLSPLFQEWAESSEPGCAQSHSVVFYFVLFCTLRIYIDVVDCRSVEPWGKASSFWSTYLIGHFVQKEEVVTSSMLSFQQRGKSERGIQSSELTHIISSRNWQFTGRAALCTALKAQHRRRERQVQRGRVWPGFWLWNASHCFLLCRWPGQEWAAATVPSRSNHGGGTSDDIHVWWRWPRKGWREKQVGGTEVFVEKSYTPADPVASNGKRKPETWRLAIQTGPKGMIWYRNLKV